MSAVGQATGQILAFGIGVALSPFPIIAVVVILSTEHGRSNARALLLGWVAGLAGAGALALLVAGSVSAHQDGGPATWVGIAQLVLGVLLLALAVQQWRGRGKKEEPAWMAGIDSLRPARAVVLGMLLAAANPKTLVMIVGAAAAIAETGADAAGQAVALAVFTLIGTLGVGGLIAVDALMGERAQKILGDVHAWMVRESATIVTVICLLLGAKLVGDAISGLSA